MCARPVSGLDVGPWRGQNEEVEGRPKVQLLESSAESPTGGRGVRERESCNGAALRPENSWGAGIQDFASGESLGTIQDTARRPSAVVEGGVEGWPLGRGAKPTTWANPMDSDVIQTVMRLTVAPGTNASSEYGTPTCAG